MAVDASQLIYPPGRLPYNPHNTQRAKKLRATMTPTESILRKRLKTQPYKSYRQRPIDNYIVDFFIPHGSIIIEIDGDTHYTDTGIYRDTHRTAVLETYGLTVIRYTNTHIYNHFDDVCHDIHTRTHVA